MPMEYNLPEDFNMDDDFSSGQGEREITLQDIADEFGWTDWRDIIAGNEDLDMDEIRGNVFDYPEDAIFYLYDAGILDFSEIWYDGEQWHVVVDKDSGG